ncbi:MAG: hypothetical protein IJ702_08380 [Fretibacterium sp.]|nr:hypothetical protein [Fretibacterium sp.]
MIALGGADMLAGVSENDATGRLPGLPRLSLRVGAEALLALRPDVVLTRSMAERMNPNLSEVLRRSGVRVESIDPPSWDEFPEYLRRLAGILGLDPEAGVEKLAALRGSIAERARASSKRAPRVLVEATARELHTCAPDSWAARLVELAGGVNVASGARPQREGSAIAPWGLERVLRTLDEGLDVYIIQRGAMNAATLEEVRARPWAEALEGVKLVEMPEDELSRPSLLGLERGGERLLDILYGEAESVLQPRNVHNKVEKPL